MARQLTFNDKDGPVKTFTEEEAFVSRNFTADSPIPWVIMEEGMKSIVLQREDGSIESWSWADDGLRP